MFSNSPVAVRVSCMTSLAKEGLTINLSCNMWSQHPNESLTDPKIIISNDFVPKILALGLIRYSGVDVISKQKICILPLLSF